MRDHYESFGTKELAPHVFALASDAYKALCVHGQSQCLVTSGESGSGKTENSKHDETESEREERERVTSVEARVWSGDI